MEGIYDGSDYLNYTAVKSISDSVPAAGATAIPYIKKYMHSPLPATSGSSDDFPIYRYSEALLLLSESLNEQGRPSEALIPLNRVRARAGLDPITETNQSSLRKLIFHERRVELAFENHRWEDLLREGDAVNIINTVGKKIKADAPYTPAGAYNIDDHNLLFPIPQTDLDLNSLLFQNPGY
ncbi:RagB/SusD family nutrient uptake outer membrane protein [Arachidicoccus rhizosphaerae]